MRGRGGRGREGEGEGEEEGERRREKERRKEAPSRRLPKEVTISSECFCVDLACVTAKDWADLFRAHGTHYGLWVSIEEVEEGKKKKTHRSSSSLSNVNIPLKHRRVHGEKLEGSDRHRGRDCTKIKHALVLQNPQIIQRITRMPRASSTITLCAHNALSKAAGS